MRLTTFTLALLMLLLGGCSSLPQPRPVPDRQLAWEEHQYRIAGLHDWSISGRLAIQSGHEGWHVTLNWRQQRQDYSILLVAPLGQGSLKLDGNAESVTLRTDEGQTVVDNDPAQLLEREFGWRVPVRSLRYWVLGVPAPGPREEQIDEFGRLSHLQQDGWAIRFLDYAPQQGVELPGRVFVSNHRARVKLVISNWELNSTP